MGCKKIKCKKWQETRRACYYDENNTLSSKVLTFIFGCEDCKLWNNKI